MSWRKRVEWPERLASPSPQTPVGIMKISLHSVGGAILIMLMGTANGVRIEHITH